MNSEGTGKEQQDEAAPHVSQTPPAEGDATAATPGAEALEGRATAASAGHGPSSTEEDAGDAASEAVTPEGEADQSSALPAWARARRTAGVAPPRRGWNPLVVVGVLLLVVVGALFAADRLQSVSSSSSASSSNTSSPTPRPLPTPTPPATPVIKGGSVAAIVNGHAVPTSRYRALLNFAARRAAGQPGVKIKVLAQQALTQIIQDQIISDYAGAHQIRLSSSELNTQIRRFKANNGGAKGFPQWLTSQDLTFDSFKTLLTASLLEQKVAQQVAPVPAAHVRHILVLVHPPGQKAVRTDTAGRAKAQQLLTQIQHGANFATLARKNSEDPGSKLKGGDLGTIYLHATVAQFDHAAFTLPLNHPALVHSEFGYHIIEVLSRVKSAPSPKDPTGQQAYQTAQQQVLTAWLSTQMKKASIKRIATVEG